MSEFLKRRRLKRQKGAVVAIETKVTCAEALTGGKIHHAPSVSEKRFAPNMLAKRAPPHKGEAMCVKAELVRALQIVRPALDIRNLNQWRLKPLAPISARRL